MLMGGKHPHDLSLRTLVIMPLLPKNEERISCYHEPLATTFEALAPDNKRSVRWSPSPHLGSTRFIKATRTKIGHVQRNVHAQD
mmetsp:Transcript_5896/g.22374  ORF Transcript_5896/g.22374 Transcript_5896/m.22374 type:complete len:84 (-) Transcript_5896:210-461(-)